MMWHIARGDLLAIRVQHLFETFKRRRSGPAQGGTKGDLPSAENDILIGSEPSYDKREGKCALVAFTLGAHDPSGGFVVLPTTMKTATIDEIRKPGLIGGTDRPPVLPWSDGKTRYVAPVYPLVVSQERIMSPWRRDKQRAEGRVCLGASAQIRERDLAWRLVSRELTRAICSDDDDATKLPAHPGPPPRGTVVDVWFRSDVATPCVVASSRRAQFESAALPKIAQRMVVVPTIPSTDESNLHIRLEPGEGGLSEARAVVPYRLYTIDPTARSVRIHSLRNCNDDRYEYEVRSLVNDAHRTSQFRITDENLLLLTALFKRLLA